MRVEMDKIMLATGIGTSVVRGSGGVVTDQFAHVWLEGDYVYVVPKAPNGPMRMYHSSSCEMYPKPGQASVPSPAVTPPLAAVGGGKK